MSKFKKLLDVSSIHISAQELIIFLSIAVLSFFLGRLSVGAEDPSYVCREERAKLITKDGEIKDLKARNTTLRDQVEEAQDSCDDRLRKKISEKDEQCAKANADRARRDREEFLDFKCSNCRRLEK